MILFAFRELTQANVFLQRLPEDLKESYVCYQNKYTASQENGASNASVQSMLEPFGRSYVRGRDFYFVLFQSEIPDIINSINSVIGGIKEGLSCENIFENIEGMWSINNSWGPCYDLINSHLASKEVVALYQQLSVGSHSTNNYLDSFPYNYICDASDIESDFSLDGGLWSTTKYTFNVVAPTTEPLPMPASVSEPVSVPVVQDIPHSESDWHMVEMRHNMDALQLDDPMDQDGDEYYDEDEDYDDDDDDENIDESQSNVVTTTNTTVIATVNVSKAPRPGISYKDMVLRPPPERVPDMIPESTLTIQGNSEVGTPTSDSAGRAQWKPRLIVTKTTETRLDRLYGPQPDSMVFDDDGKFKIKSYVYIFLFVN